METERQAYEVPGNQMRWRAAQLNAQGLPFDVQRNSNNNTYIFFVQQPPSLDPFAYQPPGQRRQAWPAWDGARVARWAIVLAAVAVLLGTIYMTFGRSEAEPQTQQQAQQTEEDSSLWDWLAGLHLPWESEPAAQANQVRQPQAKADGFKWPWERAQDAVQDTVEGVQSTVTVVSATILVVLVLLIVLALVRRRK